MFAWVRNYDPDPNYLFGTVIDFTILNLDGTVISEETYRLLDTNKKQLLVFEGIPPPAMVIELNELPFVRFKLRPFDPPQIDVKLKILPNTNLFVTPEEEILVIANELVTPGDLFPIRGIGISFARLMRVAYPLAEYGSLIAVFFNFDPSGHLLRFTQVLKYVIRLRFFKIKYGIVLEKFLREAGLSIEMPSTKGIDYIRLNSRGSHEKFTSELVPLDVFDGCLLKTILYILSCLIKIFL